MIKNSQEQWLRLDLQTFSDEVVRGGYNPEAEISFPSPESNPLLETINEPGAEELIPEPGLTPEPTPEPEPEPQLFDFGGRKVNPNDPESIQGAYEDFLNQQRYITQLSQQNQQLQSQFMQFQQMQQQQFQPQQQIQQQPQEEQFDADAFMEQFYENPDAALKSYTQKQIQEAIAQVRAEYEPIVKEKQYSEQINQIEAKYPDFTQTIPAIQQIINVRGEEFVEQIGLENAYLMAKGLTASTQQPQTPDQLLQDPNFLQQLAQNEQVRNMILQQTLQQKADTRPPQVIRNNVGGAVPLSPENRPKTLAEASRLWRASQGIN